MTHFWINDPNGQSLYVKVWAPEPSVQIKGVIQILHGMAEHIERYEAFAQFLNAAGFYVYGHDHRGHGKTAGVESNLGDFGMVDGWRRVVENVYDVNAAIRNRHPNLPILLLGHSMGSFIARCYITQFSKTVDGVILTGIGHQSSWYVKGGKIAGQVASRLYGEVRNGEVMDRLIFGRFNQKIHHAKTAFDWLSSDEEQVERYIQDPYCGHVGTLRFYNDLSNLVLFAARKDKARGIRNDLPIAIYSGIEDPVGDYGKAAGRLYQFLKGCGVNHVTYHVYPYMRHELLNEKQRGRVYTDVLSKIEWMLTLHA